MNVISKLVQNPKAKQQYFESKKKSLTYNLKISFLIKGLKKPTEINLTMMYLWEKLKKLNKRDLIPEY